MIFSSLVILAANWLQFSPTAVPSSRFSLPCPRLAPTLHWCPWCLKSFIIITIVHLQATRASVGTCCRILSTSGPISFLSFSLNSSTSSRTFSSKTTVWRYHWRVQSMCKGTCSMYITHETSTTTKVSGVSITPKSFSRPPSLLLLLFIVIFIIRARSIWFIILDNFKYTMQYCQF